MADIPPASDIASSAAQSPIQAREHAKEVNARRAAQAHAAGRHTKAVDESGVIVETGDSDSRVFADSEGSGSMGRELTDEEKEDKASEQDGASNGIREGDDGNLHIDLEA